MKRLFFITAICLLTGSFTYAQNARIGFTAGASLANYKAEYDGDDESGDTKAGLTFGVLADVPLGKSFSFQPALNFVQKGTKEEESSSGYNYKVKLTVNSLEIPLNLLYNAESNSGTFFVGAGPTIAFAMSGKMKAELDGESESEDIEFGDDPDNDFMKRLDIGANVMAGYRFPNGLFVSAGYNAGLSNLVPGGNSDDGTLKSKYFGIKIGFMLGGSKKSDK